MLSILEKEKLIDDLIAEDNTSTVKDYIDLVDELMSILSVTNDNEQGKDARDSAEHMKH